MSSASTSPAPGVATCLVDVRDVFVLSVEHPIFTAREAQDWQRGTVGEILHWPVDDYQREGRRHTRWMADDVIKYHRTVATTVNTLIDGGFRIVRLLEPEPTPEALARDAVARRRIAAADVPCRLGRESRRHLAGPPQFPFSWKWS